MENVRKMQTADMVVIGGGVLGGAVAFYLARSIPSIWLFCNFVRMPGQEKLLDSIILTGKHLKNPSIREINGNSAIINLARI